MNPSAHASDIRTLAPVEFSVPSRFRRLPELAYNLWWSWTPEARMLFASIHPRLWNLKRNPIEVLLGTEPHTWEELTQSESFEISYQRVVAAFDRYMQHPESWWFARHHGEHADKLVTYVSTEFGLHASLAVYSGGLGVLSGDHMKAASDLGLPLVGVGLLYRRGYFDQTIDAEGRQQHAYHDYDVTRLPILRVLGHDGRPLTISVPLLDRELHIAVHVVRVGRVSVLMLDSDHAQNAVHDRPITHILYVRGREMRLCQEMVLGIGAVRAMRALGWNPDVWHLNEGHSSLLLLERMREEIAAGASFEDARQIVSSNVAFTTHTPVPAGNETFDAQLMTRYLEPWQAKLKVDTNTLINAARIDSENNEEPFNMTVLALRNSNYRNGVSAKHGEVSRGMWKSVFGEDGDTPIDSITNGIHVETWLGVEMRELFHRALGERWRDVLHNPELWSEFDESISDEDLWAAHLAQKRRLIRTVRSTYRTMIARHGGAPGELAALEEFLDQDALTIGFARRFAMYKRAGLILSDLDRLERLVHDADRPVQLIFAGKAHPADLLGQELVQRIFNLAKSDRFIGRVAFIENYDMHVGRMMVGGVDAWLNNPRRPLEASGTSGQKVAANGGLNLSVLDGWWIEGYDGSHGWAIGAASTENDGGENRDDGQIDTDDAGSIYELLENEVIPCYYDRDESGLPRAWVARMRTAMRALLPRFSAKRMLQDYVHSAYLPLARETISSKE